MLIYKLYEYRIYNIIEYIKNRININWYQTINYYFIFISLLLYLSGTNKKIILKNI